MRLFLDPFFQDFADILYAAKIITKEEIQKVLRVMPNDFVKYFKEQNKGPDLDEWELGYLALKLGSRAIQTLAELNPREGFPQEQVDHADGWHFLHLTLCCNGESGLKIVERYKSIFFAMMTCLIHFSKLMIFVNFMVS